MTKKGFAGMREPLNFQLMEVSVEVHKISKFTIYNTVLLLQMKVLVRLLSIEQIIKNVNSMCISLRVKNPQTFQKSWLSLPNMSRTISNMYTHPFKPKLLTKTQIESHDKKPKDQRNIYNIYTWPIVF